jgi:putative spermidine/putrescine transport system permease protein
MGPMINRSLDKGFHLIGILMMGLILCFLIAPIAVTTIMAFDARSYLGPLPPPSFSFRWFQRFFSDDYFLKGLVTSGELACTSVVVTLCVGVATAFAVERTEFTGKEALISLFL